MVIAVVLPEGDSFALRLRLKTFLPSAFQSSANLRDNIQNTQMSQSYCYLYCWEQTHLHPSEQIQCLRFRQPCSHIRKKSKNYKKTSSH